LLEIICEQKNIHWDEALPYVEFAVRNTKHASTQFTPSEILYGERLQLPSFISRSKEFPIIKPKYCDFVKELEDTLIYIHARVKENLKSSSDKQALYYNQNKSATKFNVGDKVMLKQNKVHFPLLTPKYVGPFKVTNCLNEWLYIVENMKTGEKMTSNFNQLKRITASSTVTNRNSDIFEPKQPKEKSNIPSIISNNATVRPSRVPKPVIRYGFNSSK
jgi:hypothetical protein